MNDELDNTAGQTTGREKDGGSYVRVDDPMGAGHCTCGRRHDGAGRAEDVAAFRYARDAQAFKDAQADPDNFTIRKQGEQMVGVSGHGHAILAALDRSEANRA